MTDESPTPKNNKTPEAPQGALYEKLEISRTDGSQVSISGEIPTSAIDAHRAQAIKEIGKDMEAPGFRKGMLPEAQIVERAGEPVILKQVAEQVLGHAYPQIVINEGLDVVGQPSVELTKLAPGNPIGFTIKTAVMPEVPLPDYQAIAANEREQPIDESARAVTDEEVQQVIDNIRKQEAHQKWHEEHPDVEGHDHEEIPESQWPELSDDMVKKLGDFASVEEFKQKVRENMAREKEHKAREEKRNKLIEAILKEMNVDLPEIFVEGELSKMIAEFQQHISRMGLSFEEYLKRAEKSEADVKKEWRPEAEKRAKMQLALNKIATKENITPDQKKVDRDVAHLKEMYPDAEEDRIRVYVETVQTNDAVFQYLETGKKPGEDAEERTRGAEPHSTDDESKNQ